MGKSFTDVNAERALKPGYYFSARLCKLARLQAGEKLPLKVGPWELIADEHELSSSQVVRKLLDMKPGIDPQNLTYTVRSPLDRRFLLGDPPRRLWLRRLAGAAALVALGFVLGRSLPA